MRTRINLKLRIHFADMLKTGTILYSLISFQPQGLFHRQPRQESFGGGLHDMHVFFFFFSVCFPSLSSQRVAVFTARLQEQQRGRHALDELLD